MSNTAQFILNRVTELGVERIYGHPGDGRNGLIGAFHEVGDEPEPVPGGCCGLAGSWGFEPGHQPPAPAGLRAARLAGVAPAAALAAAALVTLRLSRRSAASSTRRRVPGLGG